MISNLLQWVRDMLVKSPRFHLRNSEVESKADLVDLLDRFIEDNLQYPLEWDDFVSWQNSNRVVEDARLEIAALENDFCSNSTSDREKALRTLKGIRDHIAASLGRPSKYRSN